VVSTHTRDAWFDLGAPHPMPFSAAHICILHVTLTLRIGPTVKHPERIL
jgi:hypothetical protein